MCASRDARWAQWHEDAELRDEIQKDVVRTLPELAFFLEGTGPDGDNAGPLRYEAMKRVLFVYAKLNPGIRPRGGGRGGRGGGAFASTIGTSTNPIVCGAGAAVCVMEGLSPFAPMYWE